MKVLLVEDSRSVVAVVKAVIETYMTDVEFRAERTLIGGVRALETWKPDAIILDIGLPDGGDPRNVVEAFSTKRKVPIIVFTGGASVSDSWILSVSSQVEAIVPKGQSPKSLVPLLVQLEKTRPKRRWAAKGSEVIGWILNLVLFLRKLK